MKFIFIGILTIITASLISVVVEMSDIVYAIIIIPLILFFLVGCLYFIGLMVFNLCTL